MRDGLYLDRNGDPVHVVRTDSGYLITYADGRTVAICTTNSPSTGAGVPPFAA